MVGKRAKDAQENASRSLTCICDTCVRSDFRGMEVESLWPGAIEQCSTIYCRAFRAEISRKDARPEDRQVWGRRSSCEIFAPAFERIMAAMAGTAKKNAEEIMALNDLLTADYRKPVSADGFEEKEKAPQSEAREENDEHL